MLLGLQCSKLPQSIGETCLLLQTKDSSGIRGCSVQRIPLSTAVLVSFFAIVLTKCCFIGTGSVKTCEHSAVLGTTYLWTNMMTNILYANVTFVCNCSNTDCFPWHLQSIKKNDKEEKHCQLPEDARVVDFGPVPRSRYPLVALLTLADEEDREIYDIVSNIRIYFRVSVFKFWMFQEIGLNKTASFLCPLEFGP